MTTTKGYALRVGGRVLVPHNATAADISAALEMMTPDEQKDAVRRINRAFRWLAWQMKHPRLTALLDGACECAAAMLTWP